MIEPGAQQLGPYQVEGTISHGGQGVVYRARHTQLGTRVALKLLISEEPDAVLRFRREAKVLARLHHPNLPRVIDLGQAQGKPYMAMELIDGQDLGARLKSGGVFSAEEIGRILGAAAHALQYCHDQGVVHRDVKPANIVLESETNRPVLVDFGLVKRDPKRFGQLTVGDRASLTADGQVMGTPAFMAPEQAEGIHGPAADVYALGATLYALLTRTPPFGGTTVYNVLSNMLKAKAPPDPRAVDPKAPRALSELSMHAMAREVEDRPPSASAFAVALDAAVSGRSRAGQGRGPLAFVAVGLAAALGAFAGSLLPREAPPRSPTPEVLSPPAPTPVAPPPSPEETRERDLARALTASSLDARFAKLRALWTEHPDDPTVQRELARIQPWGMAPMQGELPPRRYQHVMAYDPVRERVVLFGGLVPTVKEREEFNTITEARYLGDTWEWDGERWERLDPPGSPGPRAGAAMVYDASRSAMVLFGGSHKAVKLQETWTFDGTTWTKLKGLGSPPSVRNHHAMAYDSTRRAVVLFGGLGGRGPLRDTWILEKEGWRDAEPATSPLGRFGAQMVHDPLRHETLLFGGWVPGAGDLLLWKTWTWDGSNWRDRLGVGRPHPRTEHAMTWDGDRGFVVMTRGKVPPNNRGTNFVEDEWEWDGARWTLREPSFFPPCEGPQSSHRLVYDAKRKTLLAFGGRGHHWFPYQELWSWKLGEAPLHAETTWYSLSPSRIEDVDTPPFSEASDPRPGETIEWGGQRLLWRPVRASAGKVWLKAEFSGTGGVVHASGVLVSATHQRVRVFGRTTQPDSNTVWIGEQLVGSLKKTFEAIGLVEVKQGRNQITVKIANPGDGYASFSLAFAPEGDGS